MRFIVIPRTQGVPSEAHNKCVLRIDNWDDYHFQTMFEVHLFDADGTRHDIGAVKIVSTEMEQGRVDVPSRFSELSDDYCSLGQDRNYYETLSELHLDSRNEFLTAIRDCVHDREIWSRFQNQRAMQTSALRSVATNDVEAEFPLALRGGCETFALFVSLPHELFQGSACLRRRAKLTTANQRACDYWPERCWQDSPPV